MLTGNAQLSRFVDTEVRPLLAPDFTLYRKRELVRMHGPFVQFLSLSVARGGSLRVYPTFFVVGADPSVPVIPQNVSLGAEDPAAWRFQGVVLDAEFARRLVRQVEAASPLSFTGPLAADGSAIARTFHVFEARTRHWSPSLYLAHFLLTAGSRQAAAAAAVGRARVRFAALGERVTGDPPAWRIALGQRIAELERRVTSADGQGLCRAESERQAAEFGLPGIVWP
jgi:hypothetical protein